MKKKGLLYQICFWMGVALVASIGLCVGAQILLRPERRVVELILHDVAHILAMGLLMYVACVITIRRLLVRPVTEIFLHLYSTRDGCQEPLHLDGGSREVQTIVDGINAMIWRMAHEESVRDRERAVEREEQ
jgi:hypothetical protein